MIFIEDNGIEGQKFFGVKLSIDDKVIAKARATSKKKQKKKLHKELILHFKKKLTENKSELAINYIVFVKKITLSYIF